MSNEFDKYKLEGVKPNKLWIILGYIIGIIFILLFLIGITGLGIIILSIIWRLT